MTEPTHKPSRRPLMIAALAGLAAGVAVAAFYGIEGGTRNNEVAACATSPERLAALSALAKGEIAAMVVAETPRPLPDLAFLDGEGELKKLSDFRGRVVALNLWATWCVPCREEMPAFDRLQAELGGEGFDVVAISIDSGDAAKPRAFLAEIGVSHLPLYTDAKSEAFRALKSVGRAAGLPTTLLIDAAGCEIGYLPGPADWASEDAKSFVRAALPAA